MIRTFFHSGRSWLGCCLFCFGLISPGVGFCAEALELSAAIITISPDSPIPIRKAAQMLQEEILARAQVRLKQGVVSPGDGPVLALGTLPQLRQLLPGLALPEAAGLGQSEGFSIFTRWRDGRAVVCVAGNTPRGVLFGTGRLLRELRLARGRIDLAAGTNIETAPRLPLRGHQLGYRPKTNSYDAWDVPRWEQYFRDLIIFGCNAIELIPPRSDDDADSPHFPLPPMAMMVEMSRLASEYDLDVWIWYPAMDEDYARPETVEFALREWGEVFRQLPRVDAVFVPGGDPGHTAPRLLFPLLEKQAANLRRHHPRAGFWVSPQSFTAPRLEEFFELMTQEPRWLTGVVFGPQVRIPLAKLRARLPSRYPIRDYPDITHSRICQYPVPDWDLAFALTEGREGINPRPAQMARIFQVTTLPHTMGFITYSEGCNDDVNKAIWSALGWDPEMSAAEILRQYSRYFIGPSREARFAEGLLGLERNWTGVLASNRSVGETLRLFQEMEKSASPHEKLNWRFQQPLYRAYYDAFIQKRAIAELALEAEALRALAGPAPALDRAAAARQILGRATNQPVAVELLARVCELAEALFQSIQLQLSVEKYGGMPGRGNNLDDIDAPLNNRLWLMQRLAEIEGLPAEPDRRRALDEIVNWTNPGPGGFYDELGHPARRPRLLPGKRWENDPGFFETPQIGFADRFDGNRVLPMAWWRSAEAIYDAPLQMRYVGLDPSARYRIKIVYAKYKNSTPVRLLADEKHEVHPFLKRLAEPVEFEIPRAATADGELLLTWIPTPGIGANGRALQIAEVWLIKISETGQKQ